jgi:DNA-binding MarR family transcriptional regulator
MSYPAIARTIHMLSWTAHDGETLDFAGRQWNSDHEAIILAVLSADPIASVREIARKTQIPKSTVCNTLV